MLQGTTASCLEHQAYPIGLSVIWCLKTESAKAETGNNSCVENETAVAYGPILRGNPHNKYENCVASNAYATTNRKKAWSVEGAE